MTQDRPSLPEAQLALGQMFLDRGDFALATDHFAAAARGGDARGFNMLGRIHERGWGVPADAAQAAAYYRRAAEMGDAWAKFNLADLHCRGEGVARDDTVAFALYLDAAQGGHLKSLNMLGLLCEEGRAGLPDLAKAAEFYRAGAEGGDCWACLNHARLLLAEKRPADAAAFLSRAIETGFADVYRAIADTYGDHPDQRLAAVAAGAAGILME